MPGLPDTGRRNVKTTMLKPGIHLQVGRGGAARREAGPVAAVGARLWRLAPALVATVALAQAPAAHGGPPPPRILCSTFPIHQIMRYVTQGRAGLELSLLLPAGLGCPHDYALTPQDLRRIGDADVLVINGRGLDEFLGAPAVKAHPRLTVIDSAAGLETEGDGGPELHDDEAHEGEGDEGQDRHHAHADGNPHLFASPRQAARLARNLADALKRLDPDGAQLYDRNAQAFSARLTALAGEFARLGRTIGCRRVVAQHDVFEFLAQDMGMEVVGVVQRHPGENPSAAEMLALVKRIRATGAQAVFIEPQYAADVATTVAREARVPVVALDPLATGPDEAPPDYYETVMRRNLDALRKTLGGP